MIKYRLLNSNPNKHCITIFFVILSIVSTWLFITKVTTYDSVLVTGLISCEESCQIKLTLPYDKIECLKNDSILEYQNTKYNIENINYQEPYISEGMIYQDYIIDTNLKADKQIINFKILNNEQRIIQKIKRIIVER